MERPAEHELPREVPRTLWQRVKGARSWLAARLRRYLLGALAALLINAGAVLIMYLTESVPSLPPLAAVMLDLERSRPDGRPSENLLQFTEATFGEGELEMLRFGPVNTVSVDGTGSFGRAVSGYLIVESVKHVAVHTGRCRSIALRPGSKSSRKGNVTLSVEVDDCPATVRLASPRLLEGSKELMDRLGSGAVDDADIVLEPPSHFSMVFREAKERTPFGDLGDFYARQLELDGGWSFQPGPFRHCECKAADTVDFDGPVRLTELSVKDAQLHAAIDAEEATSIGCGPGDSRCGFNWKLVNPAETIRALFKAVLIRGAR